MADNINYCLGKPTRLRFWMLATEVLNAGIFLLFIAAVFAGSLWGIWFRPDWDFLEWMGWRAYKAQWTPGYSRGSHSLRKGK